MRATFRLLNSYFWKTFYGWIMAFIFPVIILAILGNLFPIQYVLPGIIAMSTLFIGILALPLAIMELRGSTLFKYIGSSPVKPWKFMFVTILFYVLISFIAIFILLFVTILIFPNYVFGNGITLKNVVNGSPTQFNRKLLSSIFTTYSGGISFLVSVIIHISLTIIIGLTIATFSKTPQQALTIALVILFPSMFLSGMVITFDIIGMSKALNWVTRFIPFRYTTANMVIATTPVEQIDVIFSPGEQNLIDNDQWFKTHIVYTKEFQIVKEADNNIFDVSKLFGTKKVPDIKPIKEFLQNYLTHIAKDTSKAVDIVNDIKNSDWDWMEIFLKQNNIMFTTADRILNFVIPLFLIVGLFGVVSKNFNWSTR
ncbi:MAG: ABC transporter permease [Mollicutes bacterium PWAP]|nr:ABC transporter permease [Mollicutes bacterium PWAP]